MQQWDFNLRRPNLHLLPTILCNKGWASLNHFILFAPFITSLSLILVDSTRRGKRIPDALSKTVPIWCAVINRAIAQRYGLQSWNLELYTPPAAVSPSEHNQIELKLDQWSKNLLVLAASSLLFTHLF